MKVMPNMSTDKSAVELYFELKRMLALTTDEHANWNQYLCELKKIKDEQKKIKQISPSKHPCVRKKEYKIYINAKKVICLTENKIFPSLSHCAEYYSLSTPRLVNCIRRQGQTKNGLKFAYL